jgi:hypothetical protein
MSIPKAARNGTIVLIAIGVALWFSSVPVAAQAGDDGGLGFDAGPDGVEVGGEDGLDVSVDAAGGNGSIDGGGGAGGVSVSGGGDDGFLGGGGGGADVGTDGVSVNANGGGGTANGDVVNDFEFGLDAGTDGNVSGVGGGTVEAFGQGGTVKCEFDTAEGQPSPDDCQTPDTGGESPLPVGPGDIAPGDGENPLPVGPGDVPPGDGENPLPLDKLQAN